MKKYLTEKGYFDLDRDGTFVITKTDMITPWEYIYQNGDIMLKVDQYGGVYTQAIPPTDIFIFKRDSNEKQSKWLNYITCDEVNSGAPITNFAFPNLAFNGEQPIDTRITFMPHKAEYFYEYKAIIVKTEMYVPRHGIVAVMKTEIINKLDKPIKIELTNHVDPYIAEAVLMPWDKPEWYLSTQAEKKGEELYFRTKLFNSEGNKSKYRYVTYATSFSGGSYCVSKELYCGAGDLQSPDGIRQGDLVCNKKEDSFFSCPPIYASKQKKIVEAKGSVTFTHVLSMQVENFSVEEESANCRFFDEEKCKETHCENEEFFKKLFSKRRINTPDKMFNYFVNSFLPLQMYWVASLDRGWPTGMRGVRDASNDFISYSALDNKLSKKVLFELFSCQRTDGWLPRQVSTLGKHGKHDLRNYVDGGVVALEFAYEYINQTGDTDILKEELSWLDSDNQDTFLNHLIACSNFYTDKNNIGEHGLVKIYGGDWLDAVNLAGLKSRGESVTVSCQCVFVLKELAEIIKLACEKGFISSKDSDKLREELFKSSNSFKENLRKYAYNKNGYFNGVFNDNGKWIFSPNDPDGEKRIYIVPNIFAIISGVADKKMTEKILRNIEELKSEHGYRLFIPPFSKRIENVGRIASGDMPAGHMENGNVYNHGSQGFFLRALAVAGKAQQFEEVLQYLLPYNKNYHPYEAALTAPYAIVNCYQRIPEFWGRGGMSFLTGTVAVALRSVYEFYFGIKMNNYGFSISPLSGGKLDGAKLEFEYLGKKVRCSYYLGSEAICLNGKVVTGQKCNVVTGKVEKFIQYDMLEDENQVDIYFS